MSRILYESRDLQAPAGGVRRLYRHVEVLTAHGFDSRVLHHSPGYKYNWIDSTAPVDYWTSNYHFTADDFLVIPEGHVDIMRSALTLPCRRIVLALNWGNIFRSLACGETWSDFGITDVIAGGHYEHYFIKNAMDIDSTTIVSGIDTTRFVPSQSKNLSIACMPRKNKDYLHLITSVFRAKFPRYKSVPFVHIDMQPHLEVAKILGQTGIFLAHTFPEGLSRKTLEAMACGNIVVGFAGRGSLECMQHDVNCLLADDGDILQAAELLGQAAAACSTASASRMANAARRTAMHYSLEREEQTLTDYWQRLTGD